MPSQWADEPYSLISTDPFSQDSSHAAYYVATQMALAHNGILRGLNSIYLQATHIPRGDLNTIQDFLTYCQCWSESMHHHHDAEEQEFFPNIERISGVQGLMERNVEQHRAFTPGFDQFQEYSRTCQPRAYDGQKMKSLIENFAEPLTKHLHEEIETLRALDKYDSGRVRQAYQRLEKILMDTDNYRVAPLVFGTADRSFEGGRHNFPAVPFFVPYIIHYVFGRRYREFMTQDLPTEDCYVFGSHPGRSNHKVQAFLHTRCASNVLLDDGQNARRLLNLSEDLAVRTPQISQDIATFHRLFQKLRGFEANDFDDKVCVPLNLSKLPYRYLNREHHHSNFCFEALGMHTSKLQTRGLTVPPEAQGLSAPHMLDMKDVGNPDGQKQCCDCCGWDVVYTRGTSE